MTTRERLRQLAAKPEPPKLYTLTSTDTGRIGPILLAVAAATLCASLGFAVAKTMTALPSRPELTDVGDPMPSPAAFPATRPTISGLPSAVSFSTAATTPDAPPPVSVDPLRWEDLTLMLRTGLRDDEIIACAGGKQLAFPIDSTRERILRGLGAGPRLLGYLHNQRVYAMPVMTEAAPITVSARSIPAVRTPSQPVYQPAPTATPDYAARDRQITDLQRRIDAIDEQIRQIRADPHWYGYIRNSTNTSQQQASDGLLARLDAERNELRRQKWQLEGR